MKINWSQPNNFSKGEKHSKAVGSYTKGKHKKNPDNILELSTRTVQKILKRIANEIELGCCYCGWNEDVCDIHHINGKKIPDCNNHKNLTYLCPNHHRLAHKGKLDISKIKTIDEILPQNWLDYYYG